MKKGLLTGAMVILMSTFSFAQLRVYNPTTKHLLNNGDTVVVFGNATNEMIFDLYVINQGFSVTVSARRDSLLLPMKRDTDNQFCWGGYCYSTATDVSTLSETLAQNDTASGPNGELEGHYFPYGHLGKAFIRYDLFNKNNPSSADSAWVVVEYDATPAGVRNISGRNISISTPYPSPASDYATINYTLAPGIQSATMNVFNLVGKCVEILPVSSQVNKMSLDVSTLPSGIYICELEASGCQPAYQRLVVSH